jgi:hypothetical protein
MIPLTPEQEEQWRAGNYGAISSMLTPGFGLSSISPSDLKNIGQSLQGFTFTPPERPDLTAQGVVQDLAINGIVYNPTNDPNNNKYFQHVLLGDRYTPEEAAILFVNSSLPVAEQTKQLEALAQQSMKLPAGQGLRPSEERVAEIAQSVTPKTYGSSGGLFGFIDSALSAVGGAVGKIGDFVSTTVTNVMENPLPTIATIALTAVGVPAPIANGLVTAATGGSMEDMVISIATSYVGGKIGAAVGDFAFPELGDVAGYGGAGDLAFQPTATDAILKTVISNASDKAATAVLQGKDFSEVLTAGVTGAVASAIGSAFGNELGDDALSVEDIDDISNNAATEILNNQDPLDVLAGAVDDYVNTYLMQGGDADLITNASDNVMTVLQQEHPSYFGPLAPEGRDLFGAADVEIPEELFQPFSFAGGFAPTQSISAEALGPRFDAAGPPRPSAPSIAPPSSGVSFATLPSDAVFGSMTQPLDFDAATLNAAFSPLAGDELGNIQRYDDGSSLQIRDDGSMVVVDTSGQSTLYPADGGAPVSADTGPVINREVILDADTRPGAAASVDQATGVDTGPKITMTDVSQEPAGLASLDSKQAADQSISNIVRDAEADAISNIVRDAESISNIGSDTGPNLTRDVTVDGTSVGSSQIGNSQVYDDGSSLQFRDDGSMVVTDVDGTTTVYPGTNLSGTGVVAGDQTGAAADATGSTTQVYDDGSSLTTNKDGSMTVTDTDGQTTLIPAVGASTSTANDTSGASNTQVFDDGSSITTMDDGSTLITDTEGNITSTLATDATTNLANTALATGTNTQTFDDGSTLQTFDDGSMLATDADGNTNFVTSDDATGGTNRGITATDPADKSLLEKATDYAKENPLTVATLGLGLLGGAISPEPAQDTTATSTPVKKTYTYGEAPPIEATSLSELFRAAPSAYTPYQVQTAPQQQMQAPQPVMGALLSGQAPGGFGLGSLPVRQVGPGKTIDISKLTPEQLNQLQSMLGPGV